MWALELWGEGSTDHRVLIPIVLRTLEELSGLSAQGFETALDRDSVTFRRLPEMLRTVTGFRSPVQKVLPHAKKVLQALDKAREKSPKTLFVAIWDHDVEPQRLEVRRQVNSHFREFGRLGAVAGICVRELEAWLIADAGAFKSCFGQGPGEGLPGTPEEEKDPKRVLERLLESCGTTSVPATDVLQRLAEHVDLSELTRKCASGYGTFRVDAKDLICPEILRR